MIKEATARERLLMGSKANHTSLKRRREPEIGLETVGQDYFFAKYLTSPDLLDLEVRFERVLENVIALIYAIFQIADTHFRRQFLFQLLILLHHLLTFTEAAQKTWSTPRNRSLQINFVLQTSEAQWVTDTIAKVHEELKATTPNGRAFAETVQVILEREKNWIKWKNELCAPFDREPWREEIEIEVDGAMQKVKVGIEEATRGQRKKMKEVPEDWPHELGTAALTEIWAMGFRDISDLQVPFQ